MLHRKSLINPGNIKASVEDRIIEGYASVFGVLDKDRDIVEPGAFTKFLAGLDSPESIPLLYQHDPSQVIGKHIELREDSKGLFFRAKMANTERATEVMQLLDEGMISGVSIGYQVNDSRQDPNLKARRLLELDLWEDSIVTFPSNGKARAQLMKQAFDLIKSEPLSLEHLKQLNDSLSAVIKALESGSAETADESGTKPNEDEEKAAPDLGFLSLVQSWRTKNQLRDLGLKG